MQELHFFVVVFVCCCYQFVWFVCVYTIQKLMKANFMFHSCTFFPISSLYFYLILIPQHNFKWMINFTLVFELSKTNRRYCCCWRLFRLFIHSKYYLMITGSYCVACCWHSKSKNIWNSITLSWLSVLFIITVYGFSFLHHEQYKCDFFLFFFLLLLIFVLLQIFNKIIEYHRTLYFFSHFFHAIFFIFSFDNNQSLTQTVFFYFHFVMLKL